MRKECLAESKPMPRGGIDPTRELGKPLEKGCLGADRGEGLVIVGPLLANLNSVPYSNSRAPSLKFAFNLYGYCIGTIIIMPLRDLPFGSSIRVIMDCRGVRLQYYFFEGFFRL